jgi:hypothetical protein
VVLRELGSREEALDALPREDETALVRFLDGEVVDRLASDSLLGFAPDSSLASLLEGELDVALDTCGSTTFAVMVSPGFALRSTSAALRYSRP